MKCRTSIIKCTLAAIALLAPSLSIAPLAASSEKGTVAQELVPDPNHCKDGRPNHGVACEKNHNPGGRIGCFASVCEARAVGAYDCIMTDSCD